MHIYFTLTECVNYFLIKEEMSVNIRLTKVTCLIVKKEWLTLETRNHEEDRM